MRPHAIELHPRSREPNRSSSRLLEFSEKRCADGLWKKLQSRHYDPSLQWGIVRLSQGIPEWTIDSERTRRPNPFGKFWKQCDGNRGDS